MDQLLSSIDVMAATPATVDMPQLTISPEATTLQPGIVKTEETKEEKKPVKKRKSWGQELPTPKTNLPPRKRAKTDDEKEQRRIERVLRNRAAAQTSRERKRLEVEKLEGEKQRVEQQNAFLLQRLAQMEAENSRLNRQVAQLSAEIRGSRGSSPKSVKSDYSISPTLTPTLFKQEHDDIPLEKIPFPTPSLSEFSSHVKPADLAESTDLTQHPAVSVEGLEGSDGDLSFLERGSSVESHTANDVAAPLSDDDFRRLFDSGSPSHPSPTLLEDGLAFDVLPGGDLSALAFDSLVDFDPDPVAVGFDAVDTSIGLSDETSFSTASVQPCPGASTSRCDGQSIAAGVA